MFVVIIFRWICGFFRFELKGRFPERFINICTRRGISIRDLNASDDAITGSCRITDKQAVILAAKKSGCTLDITKEYGLPIFCRKYISRLGLLAGAVIGAVFCVYMSGYIWNINIVTPDGLSEFEIRKELMENGLTEGVRYDYQDISRTERQVKLCDNRISWISINVFGTNAVVELSARKNVSGVSDENIDSKGKVSNLKAGADGTITRLEVQSGSPVVHAGDGVQKGQLLVSGVLEYTNGGNAFTDSKGKVFAKVRKRISFEIPEKEKKLLTDRSCCKKEAEIFGIRIPLTLTVSGDKTEYCKTRKSRMTLLSQDLPVTVTEEMHYPYEIKEKKLSSETARSMLTKRLKLYELFLSSDPDRKILKRSIDFRHEKGKYILTAELTIEENICEKSYLQTDIKEAEPPEGA